jgi:hypothetical protein
MRQHTDADSPFLRIGTCILAAGKAGGFRNQKEGEHPSK